METRDATYTQRSRVYLRKDERGKLRWFPDPGGTGTETVREVRACFDCARTFL